MKRPAVWRELQEKMNAKRTKDSGHRSKKKGGSAPHEIIVQRLAAEPDNKQTYKPVQPREFVNFEYEDLTLANLKKACASHFNLPTSTCDVLVSNKGPSCSNIAQIPHHKDKVYLVRFVVMQELEESITNQRSSSGLVSTWCEESIVNSSPAQFGKNTRKTEIPIMETKFPASVSVAHLLKAGKLVKPSSKKKVTLTFEKFNVELQKWMPGSEKEVFIECEKFGSGGFRDAFKATDKDCRSEWVVNLKIYNDKARDAIVLTLKSTIEDHARKQVQMHAVARYLAKKLAAKAPSQYGSCFQYNQCYFTSYNGRPATVEEYVSGAFIKYVNNNGQCVKPGDDWSEEYKELCAKAQSLVHFSYQASEKKLMLLDIQGSKYNLYDPEIATPQIVDDSSSEFYFCCGNYTLVGINEFLKGHKCNKYCEFLGLKIEPVEVV